MHQQKLQEEMRNQAALQEKNQEFVISQYFTYFPLDLEHCR